MDRAQTNVMSSGRAEEEEEEEEEEEIIKKRTRSRPFCPDVYLCGDIAVHQVVLDYTLWQSSQ